MNEPVPTSVEESTPLVEVAPEMILKRYLAADHDAVVADLDRARWVLLHTAPSPPTEAIPLLEAITRTEHQPQRRVAQHMIGVAHWYAGDTANAREAWTRALIESRPHRDHVWIVARNNLALVFASQGNYFEALVLFGGSVRHARHVEERTSLVYAHARRGQMYAHLGDFTRARREFGWAEAALGLVEDPVERSSVQCALLAARSHLERLVGDWEHVFALQEQRLDAMARLPEAVDTSVADAKLQRALAIVEIDPARGTEVLEEIDALPEQYAIRGRWTSEWSRDRTRLRFTVAEHAGAGLEELLPLAESWIDEIIASMRGLDRIDELARLAERLRAIGADDLARLCLDEAASEVLRRHAEVEAQHRELPELADSTEEDWTVLDEYRERLKTTRGELLTHVARAWKPGHPTFDAVVFLDQLRACAWCRRIRTLDGAWIPMAEHIPSDPRVEITHAICPECRDRHFSE